MAEMLQEPFKFPDEVEQTPATLLDDDDFEVEIVEEAAPLEKGANPEPMPREVIEEIENDDLEQYSKEAKQRILQLKKVYHDEQRAKDEALAKENEAINFAKTILEENKKLKAKLTEGEKNLVTNVRQNISYELEKAKQEYKDAYDSGDSERLVEAQDKLTEVKFKAQQLEQYKPQFDEETLQTEENAVQIQNQPQRLDSKTQAWLEKNQWYGRDDDMSYLAHGIHRRLEREGVPIGSDHYWATIDAEVRRRFPEKFGVAEETKYSSETEAKPSVKTSKPSTVVAPATRSTSSKKVTLTPRQVQIAKKLNLTPEQYARAQQKLEAQNG